MMGTFEVGQRVKILKEIVNMYGVRGDTGEILGFNESDAKVHVQVFFPGTQSDDFWFGITSIAPADAPAQADAADDDDKSYLDLVLESLAQRDAVVVTLQAENARLQAQVAAQRDCMAEMLGIMALSEGVSKEDFNRARELTQSK